jgi:hypothetical protein
VYNHYGMTEMELGGGVDCAARRGYHLREAVNNIPPSMAKRTILDWRNHA